MEEFRISLNGTQYDLKRFLIMATLRAKYYVWKSDSIMKIYNGKDELGTIYMNKNYPNGGILVGFRLFAYLYPLKELKKVIQKDKSLELTYDDIQ